MSLSTLRALVASILWKGLSETSFWEYVFFTFHQRHLPTTKHAIQKKTWILSLKWCFFDIQSIIHSSDLLEGSHFVRHDPEPPVISAGGTHRRISQERKHLFFSSFFSQVFLFAGYQWGLKNVLVLFDVNIYICTYINRIQVTHMYHVVCIYKYYQIIYIHPRNILTRPYKDLRHHLFGGIQLELWAVQLIIWVVLVSSRVSQVWPFSTEYDDHSRKPIGSAPIVPVHKELWGVYVLDLLPTQ